MEEEEIYIDLFDRYNRNEIDRAGMVDSFDEIDAGSGVDYELQCYQTALMLLEQNYLKDIIHKVEAEYLSEKKSAINKLWRIPVIL
ncbi:MAG: hypothetical protein Roseis2KO_28100 [Roseivirga sp.]